MTLTIYEFLHQLNSNRYSVSSILINLSGISDLFLCKLTFVLLTNQNPDKNKMSETSTTSGTEDDINGIIKETGAIIHHIDLLASKVENDIAVVIEKLLQEHEGLQNQVWMQ